MSSRARRALYAVVLFFAVCALAGSVLQSKVGAQSSADENQLNDNLKTFTNVYALVEDNYAEPIDSEKADTAIYDGAIPGMLRVLDPHSNFYDPKAYAKMREEQHGDYYGVGMTIQQQDGKVYVVYPAEGAPAFRAGIHPGDQIYAVDGKLVSIDGKAPDGLTSSDMVAKALKGPRGTHVQATMIREGQPKPLVFDLVRDEIKHPSVDLAYEIRPGVGYIHLTQFQETTAREVIDAIDDFGNLKGLILDLRGNPGGLLNQAVAVCDHLLSRGQIIVSQRGRGKDDVVYTATRGNGGKSFPIVVVVNRGTASAAEIVSGALQDHDRALIVGETTFGKGLVQTVYDLDEHTMALALTTYHYYTPSGLLIQRNYTGVSLYEDYYNHGGTAPADTASREVKLTDAGRTVYGGGGITPDEKIESIKEQSLPRPAALQGCLLPLCPGLYGQPLRRQELPGGRRGACGVQKLPDQSKHSLDRGRLERRRGVAEDSHQGEDLHHSVRRTAGAAHAGRLGSGDSKGAELSARSAGSGRSCPQGADRKGRGAQRGAVGPGSLRNIKGQSELQNSVHGMAIWR